MANSLLLILASGAGFTQISEPAVTVKITVSDVTGAVIPWAEVVIKSGAGTVVASATTDRIGEAEVRVEQGRYQLSTIAGGFAKLESTTEVKGPREQSIGLSLSTANSGYLGPCCFDGPNLPLIHPEPLTALIPETPGGTLAYRQVKYRLRLGGAPSK